MFSIYNYFPSQMNAPAVPLMAPIIYSHDSRIMSAAPPGFLPNASYNAGSDRIEICPDFVQGVCTSQMCPNVHPGIYTYTCIVQSSN